MTNTAIVNRVENSNVFLVHIKNYEQKEETERSFWKIKDQEFKCNNPSNLNLSKGDAVEYSTPEGKTILATFSMLILPLIVFIASFLILTNIGISSEPIASLISLILMVGSFYINKGLKLLGFKEPLPTIEKIVTKETLQSMKSQCKDCGSCTACN